MKCPTFLILLALVPAIAGWLDLDDTLDRRSASNPRNVRQHLGKFFRPSSNSANNYKPSEGKQGLPPQVLSWKVSPPADYCKPEKGNRCLPPEYLPAYTHASAPNYPGVNRLARRGDEGGDLYFRSLLHRRANLRSGRQSGGGGGGLRGVPVSLQNGGVKKPTREHTVQPNYSRDGDVTF